MNKAVRLCLGVGMIFSIGSTSYGSGSSTQSKACLGVLLGLNFPTARNLFLQKVALSNVWREALEMGPVLKGGRRAGDVEKDNFRVLSFQRKWASIQLTYELLEPGWRWRRAQLQNEFADTDSIYGQTKLVYSSGIHVLDEKLLETNEELVLLENVTENHLRVLLQPTVLLAISALLSKELITEGAFANALSGPQKLEAGLYAFADPQVFVRLAITSPSVAFSALVESDELEQPAGRFRALPGEGLFVLEGEDRQGKQFSLQVEFEPGKQGLVLTKMKTCLKGTGSWVKTEINFASKLTAREIQIGFLELASSKPH